MEHLRHGGEGKRERIEEIFGHIKPDAIAVFSMDIVEAPNELGYKSGSYADLDVRGLVSGGKANVVAAAEAAQYFPDAKIVTDTRDRDPSRGRPTHAQVYAEEIKRLGVPEECIVMEERSTSTITELVELVKMAKDNGWRSIAVMVNDFHRERTQEMFDRLSSLADPNDDEFKEALEAFNSQGGCVVFVNAEDVLLIRDPSYARLLEQARNTEAYKARVAAEQQGIKDLRGGAYRKE